MHGRDLVSVNKVSNALRMKPETKNTHRSFHGSEPGICRTAVLWRDCTGSALKRMKMKSTLARLWWLYRTRNGNDSFFYPKKKAHLYISYFKNRSQSVVHDNEHTFCPCLTIRSRLLSHTPGHYHSQQTFSSPHDCLTTKLPKRLYKSMIQVHFEFQMEWVL